MYTTGDQMKLGIIIGRFQPVHYGHLSLINTSKTNNDKTLVIMGSVNRLPNYNNPLTTEERKKLLETLVTPADDWVLQQQKDRPTDDEWVQDIVARVNNIEEDPTQVTLYCGKKDEEFYRSNFIYNVEVVKEEDISCVDIRHAWYQESLWTVEDSLPISSAAALELSDNFQELRDEWDLINNYPSQAEETYPNPVSYAVIVQDNKILIKYRDEIIGYQQPGLPGLYVLNTETTLDSCIRNTKVDTNIDLEMLIINGEAVCMAQAVEENLDSLGVRTLGVNYLFIIKPDVSLEITSDSDWIPMKDILEENTLLFYNHNLVAQRLLSKLGDK